MHRFVTPKGWRLINFALVRTAEEAGTFDFPIPIEHNLYDGSSHTRITGPAVRVWFDDQTSLIINATLEQIEGLTQ